MAAQVLNLGARGFVPQSNPTSELTEAIGKISENKLWVPPSMKDTLEKVDKELVRAVTRFRELTPKQMEVLHYLRSGLINKQIVYERKVTEATGKAYISAIVRKLEINTRTQAVLPTDNFEVG